MRAVVIAAEGPGFCAGHDLREISAHRGDPDGGRRFYEELFATCTRLMTAIRRAPLVFIAEVGGTATAAGCQLVASCDMAVASSAGAFATPGHQYRIVLFDPDGGAVARNLPTSIAMEMLLTAGTADAAEDGEIVGAGEPVVAPRSAPPRCGKYSGGKAGQAVARRARPGQAEPSTPQSRWACRGGYAFTEKVIVDNMMARDAEEGIAAFLSQAPPGLEGRVGAEPAAWIMIGYDADYIRTILSSVRTSPWSAPRPTR